MSTSVLTRFVSALGILALLTGIMPISFVNAATVDAVLMLSPTTGSFEVNDAVAVDLKLNAGSTSIGGLSAVITYPSDLLTFTNQTEASNNLTGSAFPIAMDYATATIDTGTDTGTIKLSQYTIGAGVTSANAQVLRLNFTAIGTGTANVSIVNNDYNYQHSTEPGSEVLSSVAEGETYPDVLSSVVNASFTITAPPVPNVAPTVSITAPANNTVYGINDTVTLTADASDSDGTVSSVQFKHGTTNIGSADTTSPYSASWDTTGLAAGDYTVTAVATDDSSASTTSTPITVKIRDFIYDVQSSTALSEDKTTASITTTWSTTADSTSQVEINVRPETVLVGEFNPIRDTAPMVSSHSYTISGLKPCTVYYYNAKSVDSNENIYVSDKLAKLTPGCEGTLLDGQYSAFRATVAEGGTGALSSGGRGLGLSVPAAFSSSDHVFQILKLDKASTLETAQGLENSSRAVVGDFVYRLSALMDHNTVSPTFDKPITLTFTYSDDDIKNMNENTLSVRRWDNATDGWQELTCERNAANNTVTCTTTQFSLFSLVGTPASSAPAGTTTQTPAGELPQTGANILLAWLSALVVLGAILAKKHMLQLSSQATAPEEMAHVPNTENEPEVQVVYVRRISDISKR